MAYYSQLWWSCTGCVSFTEDEHDIHQFYMKFIKDDEMVTLDLYRRNINFNNSKFEFFRPDYENSES